MKSRWFLSMMLCLGLTTVTYAGPLGKGKKAPEIKGKAWVQAGKDAKAPSAKDLKGKVIVVEFFAFW